MLHTVLKINNIRKRSMRRRRKISFLRKNNFDRSYEQLCTHGTNHGSKNVTNGNFVLNSEDVENGMYSFNLKDAKNTLVVGSPKENQWMYDAFEAGSLGNSHFYGVMNT